MPESIETPPPVASTPAAPPVAAAIKVTPNELVALYEKLHEREWDKNRSSFKNPSTVMNSVLHYGRIGAARLIDAFTWLGALEKRVTALEAFRHEAEEQGALALQQFEAIMQKEAATASPPEAPVVAAPAVATVESAPPVAGLLPETATAPATPAPVPVSVQAPVVDTAAPTPAAPPAAAAKRPAKVPAKSAPAKKEGSKGKA